MLVPIYKTALRLNPKDGKIYQHCPHNLKFYTFFLNLTVAELVKKISSYYGTQTSLPLSHNPANFSSPESNVCNIFTLFYSLI